RSHRDLLSAPAELAAGLAAGARARAAPGATAAARWSSRSVTGRSADSPRRALVRARNAGPGPSGPRWFPRSPAAEAGDSAFRVERLFDQTTPAPAPLCDRGHRALRLGPRAVL